MKRKTPRTPRRTGGRGVTPDVVRALFRGLPGVEEGPCYGTPGWRVAKKFLARLREDGDSLAVRIGFEERDILFASDPETFFTTDHYAGYPAVLVRLSRVGKDALRQVLEQAWRQRAPKRLLARLEAKRAT